MTNLTERSITSAFYNSSTQLFLFFVGFGRSIILSRLIAPEVFGTYALAMSINIIVFSFANAGLTGPLLHHAEESEGDAGAKTHFTLNLIISTFLVFILLGYIFLFVDFSLRTLYMVIIFSGFMNQLTITQKTLLIKEVLFKKIALANIITIFVTTFVSVLFAVMGFGVWSLVSISFLSSIIAFVYLNLIRPNWRVRFGWYSSSIRYFMNFGSKTFIAGVLSTMLDNIDNLWVGSTLGATSLGYYSKAYEFASYPRNLLAQPFNDVASGTFAELKSDPMRLSKAFIHYNKLLIRIGFAASGFLILTAPEIIALLIGEKWLPMLVPFRFMLVFSMLDPIKISIASVLVAVGRPGLVAFSRTIQFLVLISCFQLLGKYWGITGVALSIDLMIAVGICLLLFFASKYVNFSLTQLFKVPLIGLLLGIMAGLFASLVLKSSDSELLSGIIKGLLFSLVYFGTIILFDRSFVYDILGILRTIGLRPR